MKITRKQLCRVIREELERHLFEATEADARLVHAATPSTANTVKHGTMMPALEQGMWDEVVRQGATLGITPESAFKSLVDDADWPGSGLAGKSGVIAGQFDMMAEKQGLAAAINFALENGVEFADDSGGALMAWARENR